MHNITKHLLHVFAIILLLSTGCNRQPAGQAARTLMIADSLDAVDILYNDTMQLQQAADFGNKSQQAKAYYYLARNYSEAKHDDRAMECFLHASDYNRDDRLLQGRIYSNIGYICGLYGEDALSIKYFTLAGKCYSDIADTIRIAGNMLEMARIYNRNTQTYPQADSLLLHASGMNLDSSLLGKVMDTKAILLGERGEYYPAIIYAQQALTFIADSCQYELTAYRHLQLAKLYHKACLTDSVIPHAQYVISHSHNEYYLKKAYSQLTAISIAQNTDNNYQKTLDYTRGQVQQTENASWRLETLHRSIDILQKWENKHRTNKIAATTACIFALLLTIIILALRHQHINQKQLQQLVNNLQVQLNNAEGENQRRLLQRKIDNIKHIQLFNDAHPDFGKSEQWKKSQLFNSLMSHEFPQLMLQLDSHGLNITEQRICILILLGNYDSHDMADLCNISYSSISKLKSRAAEKLNTSTAQLRNFLIEYV